MLDPAGRRVCSRLKCTYWRVVREAAARRKKKESARITYIDLLFRKAGTSTCCRDFFCDYFCISYHDSTDLLHLISSQEPTLSLLPSCILSRKIWVMIDCGQYLVLMCGAISHCGYSASQSTHPFLARLQTEVENVRT